MEEDYMPFAISFKNALQKTMMEGIMYKLPILIILMVTWYEFAFMRMLLGGWDVVYLALVVAMVLDTATGISKAFYLHQFKIAIMRQSVGKWSCYFILLILGHQASMVHSFLHWMREGTAIFIFLTEYQSIAMNLRALGFYMPMPKDLWKFISNFKKGK